MMPKISGLLKGLYEFVLGVFDSKIKQQFLQPHYLAPKEVAMQRYTGQSQLKS
jgi:hypothetical protein